jgi:uncharacterized protein YegL
MSGTRIDNVNNILPTLKTSLVTEPALSDLVLFGMIDFADEAHVVTPLGRLDETASPTLQTRGATSYAAAFDTVRTAIEHDVTRLLELGYRVYRPAVFFFSDGIPTDGASQWERSFRELTYYDASSGAGFKRYPLIVPFAVGEADRKLLARLCHPSGVSKLYAARNGADIATAISEMAKVMLKSLVMSGRSGAAGQPKHVLPSQAEVGESVEVISQYGDDGDYFE